MLKRDVPMKILFTVQQRQMLEQLAKWQRRSMNDVVRLAIERVYQAEMLRASDATGRSSATGRALARSD